LPDSDPETETDTSEYRDAEEGPSGARTHESSSSPEPRQVEGPPEEPNESEPSTNEDLSASFSAAGWTPFEPRPEPYNPFHIPQSPLLLPVLEMADVIMNDHDSKIKEVKLNPPKPFDGKRENLKKFIQDGELYITINKKTYDDEIKKIGFFLSFMNEGDAASWKEQLLDDAMTRAQASNTDLNLGTYAQFKHDLQEAFAPYDSPGDALERMKLLRMKKDDSIDEHIAKFRMLVSESKLDKSSPVIIDFFRETLGFPLQRRIMTLENPPKKIDDWYEWATKLDHQWRRMQRIMGRTQTNHPKTNASNKRFFPRKERDPNAMDIDAMSFDERKKLMQDGKCFRCKRPGHISKDCPLKNEPQKKMNGMEMQKHVRSLIAGLEEEERENFWKEAEDAGF
jgi:hypothetical protein